MTSGQTTRANRIDDADRKSWRERVGGRLLADAKTLAAAADASSDIGSPRNAGWEVLRGPVPNVLDTLGPATRLAYPPTRGAASRADARTPIRDGGTALAASGEVRPDRLQCR